MVPPLAIARKNLERRKTGNHGTTEAVIPKILSSMMQVINTTFLPFLSAKIPKAMLPET